MKQIDDPFSFLSFRRDESDSEVLSRYYPEGMLTNNDSVTNAGVLGSTTTVTFSK